MSGKATVNEHIKSYLDYYLSLAYPPKYAVIINGSWGIGKTYFIKKYFKERFKNNEGYCYISLYGVQSNEDIDSAILEGSYPLLGKKGIKVTGRLVKAAMKSFRFEPDLKLASLLKKTNINVFVFDDLERCLMPINKTLGYINEIVEHDDGRAIIVANEKELAKDSDYLRCREKLIGKTLELESSFGEAFLYFISKINSERTQTLLSKNAELIEKLYNQSELQNLRILQQTIWDFERLVQIIPSKYHSNFSAIKELIALFFPISMEFKAGRIGEQDLLDRTNRVVAGQLNKDPNKTFPLHVASNRYEIKLYSDILSDEILVDLLVKGIFESRKVEALFKNSPYFETTAEPAWKTVWHGIDKTDEEFQPAFTEMEQQFKERKFLLSGEIVHVFGLRLWLSEIGVLSENLEAVVVECKKYVDDLYSAKALEPTTYNGSSDLRFNGYAGLAIFRAETKEFRELFEYLEAKRKLAEKDSYESIGKSLLEDMKNPDKFYGLLCYTHGGNNLYARVPILAAVDPKVFVDELLKHPPRVQRDLVHTFRGRYEAGSLAIELKEERAWLEEVRKILVERAEGLSPLHEHRIHNDIKYNIAPALDNLSD